MIDGPQAIGTFPEGMNAKGEIVGGYVDSSGTHGFFRSRKGKFITLTIPNATSSDARAINVHGTITGTYSVMNGNSHGFVLLHEGPRGDD